MDPSALLSSIYEWLQNSHPAWLLAGLILLPLGPVPASVLVVLIGARFGIVGGIIVTAIGLIGNLALAFIIARTMGRPAVEKCFGRWFQIPSFSAASKSGNITRFILIFRITPGIPLFVQNYALGFAAVPFGKYMLISLPIVLTYAIAALLFGQALFSGHTGWAITGCLLAISLVLILKFVFDYLRNRLKNQIEPNE